MDTLALLNSTEVKQIIEQYNDVKKEKQNAAYNLLTISTYNSYLENYHSDIIASLLKPDGLHKQGNTFLHRFIDYLNQIGKFDLSVSRFGNAVVSRETGRLDIWIKDEESKEAIIIENKINNAPDIDEQIDRYYIYSEMKRGYKVKAIVYLSLDGTKKAPPTTADLGKLVINIGAFTKEETDLVLGWLQPCLKAANNDDSFSFIHQYIKLIQHLANKSMDTTTMDSFYQYLSENDGIGTVQDIIEMYERMASFRADEFGRKITDYGPFRKPYRYRPHYWLYENYQEGLASYKIDVGFENNGNAYVVFWDNKNNGEIGKKYLENKLTQVGLLEEFPESSHYNDNGYSKRFVIGDKYKNMAEVDHAIADFVIMFFKKLKVSTSSSLQ